MLAAEGRGRRLRVASDVDDETLRGALASLRDFLTRETGVHRHRLRTLDTIDGHPAASSARIGVLRDLGFRRGGLGLEWPSGPLGGR